MKKLFLLLSVFVLFNSCTPEQDIYSIVVLPVESVTDLPVEFVLGETYQITMKFYRPTTCHSLYGIYYEKELNTRTFAVRNMKEERGGCTELTDVLITQNFTFHVTNTGNYIFKFWTGTDDEGNNTYLEYNIPVI
ncbi:hypothetical protein ACFSX9_07825 [Flavobacterium ardleyense]|uniref:Lipoprotein n=1 Tax=Flavobacterium ardleyense TaxID=2038737 RepID=A0ABW5Z978_9FLAO